MSSARRLVTLAALILAGCAPARHATESRQDSVVVTVREVVRDTVIMVQVPDESDRAVLPDSDTSRLSTSLAESEAWVSGGQLHHTLRNHSERVLPVSLQYVDRVRSERTSQLATVREVVEVPRELTPWQRFIMGVGWAALLALALWLALKLHPFCK